MLQPKIISVKPMESYMLYLIYETGEHKLFNVTPYITGSWYGKLKNVEYFNKVYVTEDGGIEWPDGQDVAPHELYSNNETVEPSI